MNHQDHINENKRAIVINCLIMVHMKFGLVPETLYLCVYIIDQYCSVINVRQMELKLIGLMALLLA